MRVIVLTNSPPPITTAFNEDISTSEMIVGNLKKNTKLISAIRCQDVLLFGMEERQEGAGVP